jgi:RNA polymerase sigma-70 factor (ECF subfamily)
LQFHEFDESYLQRLRSGDFLVQEHFVNYFTELIHLKLRSRVSSSQAIEDIRQETFFRVFRALKNGDIRQADRLGSYVNSICNNVLKEHYRHGTRETPLEGEPDESFPDGSVDVLNSMMRKQSQENVRQILDKMPERDRRILKAIFIDETDKDTVCRDFGVDRNYLRVLLHRAKQAFKALYLNNLGDDLDPGDVP